MLFFIITAAYGIIYQILCLTLVTTTSSKFQDYSVMSLSMSTFSRKIYKPNLIYNGIVPSKCRCIASSRLSLPRKHFPTRISSKLFLSSTSTAATATTSFQPPEPPGTKGIPIFNDVTMMKPEDVHMYENAVRRNSDTNAVMVVTGANRGIGLQFVKSLLQHTKGTIFACCRSPETATDLHDLIATLDATLKHRIQLIPLDMTQQSSIENAGKTMKDKCSRIDLLLNVAGILGDGTTTPGPERALSKIDRSWLETTMAVNVIGPVMFTKELLPLLTQQQRRGRPKEGEVVQEEKAPRPNAVIVNMSARVGSITDNGLGGWYSYRMSKTALNQATRTMALELKRNLVWTVALHPGTTDTDLSKPFHKNVKDGSLFPVDFTVSQLLCLIDSLKEENSGGFYDWSGKAISF